MDVSFAVVGRVDGEVFLCRQTFLERGTIPGRMVFCTGKTKVLDLDQSREAQAVPGGNVFEGTWGSCCHFRVPCQGMRELLCFSQTFWCHCHLIPVTSPLWRFASKPRICPPGHPQPPLPLPCSHRRGVPRGASGWTVLTVSLTHSAQTSGNGKLEFDEFKVFWGKLKTWTVRSVAVHGL